MKHLSRIFGAFTLFSMLSLMGASCLKGGSQAAQQAYRPITLEYWTVFNSPDAYQDVINDYEATHPNIHVNVKKLLFDEYETKLVNALAEDRGPDVFSVHHTWLPSYRSKLLPLPATTSLAQQVVTGSIKKETSVQIQTLRSLNEADVQSQFLGQVFKDVYLPELIIKGEDQSYGAKRIYGLPIAFDTMVLFYNRDLLDNAGIAQPAKTWNEFQDQVKRLARFDSKGNILIAGGSIGAAQNVPRSMDILSLLMMQNGAEMTREGQVSFHEYPQSLRGQRATLPSEDALKFYTSFANPNLQNYTWNETLPNGFDAFVQGKSAYFFGYSYHLDQIRALAPKLNFGISTMPQIQGNPQINYANYWVEGVSRKTKNADAAWDFVQFMTAQPEAAKFLAKAKRPTARRDLVNAQLDDTDLFVFASQLLTSQAWYNGEDAAAMEKIMKDLITDSLAGADELNKLLKLAAQRVQQTY